MSEKNSSQYGRLTSIFELSNIGMNQKKLFFANQDESWVQDLLEELNEKVEPHEREKFPHQSDLSVEISMEKKTNPYLKEHLIVKGNVSAHFYTECIRCLDVMLDQVSSDLALCFLPVELKNQQDFQDQDTVLCENEELDLFFHQNKRADIAEVLHEMIYLCVNQNPLHDDNCKGLCQTCGLNLNHGQCEHQNSQNLH